MSSTQMTAHYGESFTDLTLRFSKRVQAAEKELSLLQIELGRVRALADTKQLSTSQVNILIGGLESDSIDQFLLGLVALRGRLSEILSSLSY